MGDALVVGAPLKKSNYKNLDRPLSPDFHGGGGQEWRDAVRTDCWEVLGEAQLVEHIRDEVRSNPISRAISPR